MEPLSKKAQELEVWIDLCNILPKTLTELEKLMLNKEMHKFPESANDV